MNSFTKTVVIMLACAAGSAAAEERHKREVYGFGQIFQNVAAKHVVPLLRNQAWVTHWENSAGHPPDGGYVAIVWYGADGTESRCLQDSVKGGSEGWGTSTYSGVTEEFKARAVRYPLKKGVFVDGVDYQLLRYNGATGDLTTFIWEKRRWWEADVGHLQARIPAVT